MQRPTRTGDAITPDRTRSIELLVDALLRRPAVQQPRAEGGRRETVQRRTPPT